MNSLADGMTGEDLTAELRCCVPTCVTPLSAARRNSHSTYSIANQTGLAHETKIVFSTHLAQEAMQNPYGRG